jgi:hypothetical protein
MVIQLSNTVKRSKLCLDAPALFDPDLRREGMGVAFEIFITG